MSPKRYLIHVAGVNLGVLMRALGGCGAPREAASAKTALLFLFQMEISTAIIILAEFDEAPAMFAVVVTRAPN